MYRRTSWMPEPRSGTSSLSSLLLLKFQKKMLRGWLLKGINVFLASGLMLIRTNFWREEQTKNMCQSSKAGWCHAAISKSVKVWDQTVLQQTQKLTTFFAVGRRSRVHTCTVQTSHPHIFKVVLLTESSLWDNPEEVSRELIQRCFSLWECLCMD